MKKLVIGFLTAMVVVVGVLAFPKVAEAIPLSQAYYYDNKITGSNSTGWTDYAWNGQCGYPSWSTVRVRIFKPNGYVVANSGYWRRKGWNSANASVYCGKGTSGKNYAYSLINEFTLINR